MSTATGSSPQAMSATQSSKKSANWAGDLTSKLYAIDSTSAVVFSVICVLVLIVIVAYIIWRVRRSNLTSNLLVRDPIRMYGSSMPLTVDQSKFPSTMNGSDYSYSFWLYLISYDATNQPILLFGRNTHAEGSGGSPIVYLDKDKNTMYVSIATSKAASTDLTLDKIATSNEYVTATIDYVPLQRWVNVSIVVQDYLMTLYMDGDIYTVANVTDTPTGSLTRAIFGSTTGDMTVGSATPGGQPKAFFSHLRFFNFALTQRDVSANYGNGPFGVNSLSMFGIPAYGIRSPVYKID